MELSLNFLLLRGRGISIPISSNILDKTQPKEKQIEKNGQFARLYWANIGFQKYHISIIFSFILNMNSGRKIMASYSFDDNNIRWQQFGDFDYFVYSILNINEKNKIIEVLFKFEANQQIFLHKHKALNTTFVIQGEHRLYEPNGEIKEIRAVGTYTSSPASEEPHREGGGGEGAVVLFSIRWNDGILYEILDDDANLIGTVSWKDLVALYT